MELQSSMRALRRRRCRPVVLAASAVRDVSSAIAADGCSAAVVAAVPTAAVSDHSHRSNPRPLRCRRRCYHRFEVTTRAPAGGGDPLALAAAAADGAVPTGESWRPTADADNFAFVSLSAAADALVGVAGSMTT